MQYVPTVVGVIALWNVERNTDYVIKSKAPDWAFMWSRAKHLIERLCDQEQSTW